MSGNFPVDIVIFAMIAAFLALRLRSVLGRRTGFEHPPRPMPRPGAMPFQRPDRANADQALDRKTGKSADKTIVIEGRAEPVDAPGMRVVPGIDTDLGRVLADIHGVDPGFDPQRFMTNAERAFCTILGAYCAGQKDVLRPLLTAEAFSGFDEAIDAREQAGETVRCELRRVHDMSIQAASLREATGDQVASITLRIVSDQINVTTDKTGKAVAGVDAVAEILDLWTFERHLLEASPIWRLAGAQVG